MDLTAEQRLSDSPFVEHVWRTDGAQAGNFISIAQIHYGMVITKYQGTITLTVRGPETMATPAQGLTGAEYLGVLFKPGTLLTNFPAQMVMDRQDVNLPLAGSQSFWLHGAAWEFPDYENFDTFLNRLVHDGLLVHDPLVSAVLTGKPLQMSLRTVQRRFLQATGMTHGMVAQIERARHATMLLKQGVPILDVVEQAGYADQPHLTRALKYRIGQTPAQILSKERLDPLSFLFKTLSF